jgi:phosphate transport system substrate-binding protein
MFLPPVIEISKLIAAMLVSLILGTIASSMAATDVPVSGSTTVGPLAALCADAFNAAQNDYRVSVAQTGTGAGVTAIGTGTADVAMASREITADEKSKYGDKFQETLIGYDGIAICVSKAIYDAGVTALTKDKVKKIYAGNITNWKELGGPDKQIYVISREQGSGTRDSFLTDIFGNTKAEAPAVSTYSSSNSEIKTAITGSDHAIGYLGYSYSQGGDLKAVKIEGVEVNPQTIKNKTYPLARALYLDTLGDPKPGARAFIDFVKGTDGQKIASDNGFVPL